MTTSSNPTRGTIAPASPTTAATATDRRTEPEAEADRNADRWGGLGALVAAAAFVFGIGLFITTLADYTSDDATPAESVDFLVEHQGTLFSWYLVIYLVFGAAIIPLTRALHRKLAPGSPGLADVGAAFGYIWAGLMFATGMIVSIGIGEVADLAATDPAAAEGLWLSIETVGNGLGGGNELVGGAWVLLVSLAAIRQRALSRIVNGIGVLSATAGLVTVVPGLEDVGMVFGLGVIVWFAAVGVNLLRNRAAVSR